MNIRNTYLEKKIRTKYVPNGVFRESNTHLVRTSVNTYQIRTKYVLRISIFVAYLRFKMGKMRLFIYFFSLGCVRLGFVICCLTFLLRYSRKRTVGRLKTDGRTEE